MKTIKIIRKQLIPLSVKTNVWLTYHHPIDIRIAQCCTCDNIIRIPESLRKYFELSIEDLPYKCNGVAEFGHIISEYNGGKATIDNLKPQCKTCNTKLGSNNMENISIDSVMISSENMIDTMNINNTNEYCLKFLDNKFRQCRNTPITGSQYCHVHFI